ncbi:hypothetical protein O9929_10210 [Vibrio lentus]|nr:hypothetical protein [Vibrio lentus]
MFQLKVKEINKKHILVAAAGCCCTNGSTVDRFSMIIVLGWFHGIHFRWCNRLERDTHDGVFTKGVHMMAMISVSS